MLRTRKNIQNRRDQDEREVRELKAHASEVCAALSRSIGVLRSAPRPIPVVWETDLIVVGGGVAAGCVRLRPSDPVGTARIVLSESVLLSHALRSSMRVARAGVAEAVAHELAHVLEAAWRRRIHLRQRQRQRQRHPNHVQHQEQQEQQKEQEQHAHQHGASFRAAARMVARAAEALGIRGLGVNNNGKSSNFRIRNKFS